MANLPGDLPPDVYFPMVAAMHAAASLEWARTCIRARYNQPPAEATPQQLAQRHAMLAIVEGLINAEISAEINKVVDCFNKLNEAPSKEQRV